MTLKRFGHFLVLLFATGLVVFGCSKGNSPLMPAVNSFTTVKVPMVDSKGHALSASQYTFLYLLMGQGAPVTGSVGPVPSSNVTSTYSFTINPSSTNYDYIALQINDSAAQTVVAVGAEAFTFVAGGTIPVTLGPIKTCYNVQGLSIGDAFGFENNTTTFVGANTATLVAGLDVVFNQAGSGYAIENAALANNTVAYVGNGNWVNFLQVPPVSSFFVSSGQSKGYVTAGVSNNPSAYPAALGDVYCVKILSGGYAWLQVNNLAGGNLGFVFRPNTSQLYCGYEMSTADQNNFCNGATPTWTNTPLATSTQTSTNTAPPANTATSTSTSTSTNTAGANTSTSTNTMTPTPTATSTNTSGNTNTVTMTVTNTTTSTPTNTAVFTSTFTSTDTAGNTNTVTMTPTDTFTSTPTNTAVNTGTSTLTSTYTNTGTPSNTAVFTSTYTSTGTDTTTNTPTDTGVNTNTATPTSTNTSSNTPTDTPANTNTSTPTGTNTATSTSTDTAGNTNTPTPTQTNTSTNTVSNTPTDTVANTATATATLTNTSTDTSTDTPANTSTATSTLTNTSTDTPTDTAVNTNTATPTSTDTNTPTLTATNSATPSSGVVVTLAGNPGIPGSSDGTGNAAGFKNPNGIAIDGTGNLFITDSGNNLIRKIAPGGVVTTIAGQLTAGTLDGTGSAAQFSNPSGIAVDSAGILYVADYANHTIRQIASGGVVTTIAGTVGSFGHLDGTGTSASFYQPSCIVTDSTNLFICDYANSTIRKMVISTGVVTTVAGTATVAGNVNGLGTAAQFNYPTGIALDGAGNIFVADTGNNMIRKIDTAGNVTTVAGNGTAGYADGPPASAQFKSPTGLVVDGTGNIFVSDSGNAIVREIQAGGNVITVAGNAGNPGFADGAGGSANMSNPTDMVLDAANNILFTDTGNHIIRKIN